MSAASASDPKKRAKNLAPEQIRLIAERIAAGESHAAIAVRFCVSVETVRAIKAGKRGSRAVDADLRARMKSATPATTLDASSARRVMDALEAGRTGRSIAEEFGISPSMVSAIKHGHAWSSLDPGLPARLTDKPQRGKALTAAQVGEIKRASTQASRHARWPPSSASHRRRSRPSRRAGRGPRSGRGATDTHAPVPGLALADLRPPPPASGSRFGRG